MVSKEGLIKTSRMGKGYLDFRCGDSTIAEDAVNKVRGLVKTVKKILKK